MASYAGDATYAPSASACADPAATITVGRAPAGDRRAGEIRAGRHVQAATWPQPNPLEVDACARVAWDEFVHDAETDTGDVYSWWCKNQLNELKDHPLIVAYACRLETGSPDEEDAPPLILRPDPASSRGEDDRGAA